MGDVDPDVPPAVVLSDEEDMGSDRANAFATAAGLETDAERERSVVDEKACANQPDRRPDISARRAGDPPALCTTLSRLDDSELLSAAERSVPTLGRRIASAMEPPGTGASVDGGSMMVGVDDGSLSGRAP